MQPERLLAGDGSGTGFEQRSEPVGAGIEGSRKGVFLGAQRALHKLAILDDLRVGLAHGVDDRADARHKAPV